MDYWTNTDNALWRTFSDGLEKECPYAGVTYLSSSKEKAATSPCMYCGQVIPTTKGHCANCGGPRLMLIAGCRIEIKAKLPDGGSLMDLDERSVLEVRRRGWKFHDGNAYFRDGGLSVRSIGTRYSVWAAPSSFPSGDPVQPWVKPPISSHPIEEKAAENKDKDTVIIRMSEFSLVTMHINAPVPLFPNGVDILTIAITLDCKAEFFFGERQ